MSWITEFTSGLHETTKVIAVGTREGKCAVLTENSIYGQRWVWSQGKKTASCDVPDDLFQPAAEG